MQDDWPAALGQGQDQDEVRGAEEAKGRVRAGAEGAGEDQQRHEQEQDEVRGAEEAKARYEPGLKEQEWTGISSDIGEETTSEVSEQQK